MEESVISARGFRKCYGAAVAVKDLTFDVKRGEIFALLGPNGSGKTSTLESLEGLRRPDGGQLSVAGIDPARQPTRLARRIGVQLQTSALPPAMTVDEAMRFFAAYHGVAQQPALLERLGLSEKRSVQYARLSVGQQRRLALAIAVCHRPQVLFLDEPTAGLDVQSRVDLHGMIRELRDGGTTVILATHDMAEAEKLADRAGILLKGELAAIGSPRQLTASGVRRTRISISTENGTLLQPGAQVCGAQLARCEEGYAVYYSDDPGPAVASILARLEEAGDALVDLRVERPTLEERFLEITSGGKT